MEEKTQAPPAPPPPVSAETSPPPAPEPPPRAPLEQVEDEDARTVYEIVGEHVDACSKLETHPEAHMLVSEHAAAAELSPTERRALLARFHAQGLRETSRIHPDVFQLALDEALHGRV